MVDIEYARDVLGRSRVSSGEGSAKRYSFVFGEMRSTFTSSYLLKTDALITLPVEVEDIKSKQ